MLLLNFIDFQTGGKEGLCHGWVKVTSERNMQAVELGLNFWIMRNYANGICAHGSGTAISERGHAVVSGVGIKSLFVCHSIAITW